MNPIRLTSYFLVLSWHRLYMETSYIYGVFIIYGNKLLDRFSSNLSIWAIYGKFRKCSLNRKSRSYIYIYGILVYIWKVQKRYMEVFEEIRVVYYIELPYMYLGDMPLLMWHFDNMAPLTSPYQGYIISLV